MDLPHIDLHYLPIEFKEINPSDFNSQHYVVGAKQIITPPDNGYISKQIIDLIRENFDEKNTVVINAGVGQGKSTAVIEMVKNYANNDNYVVIVAVPYNSLIKQYVDDFTNNSEVERDSVFNLSEIENYNFLNEEESHQKMGYGFVDEKELINQKKISHFKIHIMTINGLLGNSGEDSLFQSEKRIMYFGKLHTYCQKNNKKLIVFFDEIHDSIYNFKEVYLYKLWKFKGLIHKTFVVSATFNEASKEVIKYLCEFTDNKIQIIESERKIIVEKQSRLHLIFQDSRSISENKNLNKVFEDLVKNDKDFDVIVYSKKQIKNLKSNYYSPILEAITKSKKKVNYCYSDVFGGKEVNVNSSDIDHLIPI